MVDQQAIAVGVNAVLRRQYGLRNAGRLRVNAGPKGTQMRWNDRGGLVTTLMAVGLLACVSRPAVAAVHIEGEVQAAGAPVAHSTVALWAASASAPARLAQVETGADGHFVISTDQSPGGDASLYLLANGGEPANGKVPGNNSSPRVAGSDWATNLPRRSSSTK